MRLFAKLFLLLTLCAGIPLALLGGTAMWRLSVLRGVLLDSSARTGESSAVAGEQATFGEALRLHRAVVERRASEMSEFFEQDRRFVELTAANARAALRDGPSAASAAQWSDAKMAELRKSPGFDETTLGKAPYSVYHLAPGVAPESVRRPLESLARLGDYFSYVRREMPWLKSIYFAHADGFIIGYPAGSPFPAGYDPRTREWYLKAADRKRLTWSNFYTDKDGKPIITCTLPILEGGKVVGVAAVDVSLEMYLNRLFDLRELPASDALLVNEHGGIRVAASVKSAGKFSWDSWDWKVAPSVESYIGGKLAPAFRAAHKADGGAFLTDAQGRITTDPRAARGGDLLSFARRESRTGAGGKYWYYLVRTPTARVAGPVDEIRDRLYALSGALAKAIDALSRTLARELSWAVFLALLAAMVAAWLGARTVSRPLTALASAVRRVGRGDFETRVPPGGADEVGEVSRAVNEMISGLKEGVFVKNTFKRYLSASVVDQIIKDPSSLKLGGEERELTVFFSDMSGFTEMSEKLKPQELIGLINEYLSAMTDSIFLQEGTLDKYEGDAVMAFWGAPLAQPDHARRACWAALDNRSRLKELCKDWERRGLPSFDIRIGINTGSMIVGNVGSHARMEYTVLGDAVNTGSRLEQLSKHYGTHILISEATRDAAGGAVETREVDLIELRGKKKHIRVYELLGLPGQIPAAKLAGYRLYEHGLVALREGRLSEAEAALRSAIVALGEDRPSALLLERLAVMSRA